MANPEAMARAAGTAYTAPTGRTLFVKRAGDSDHGGEWCFPGGGIEDGETADEAAQRESLEEIGMNPPGERSVLGTNEGEGVHYTTFAQAVEAEFTPALNDEHTEHAWAAMSNPPEPLHPGVRKTIDASMALDRALPKHDRLAFDKGTVRSYDVDGRLHVKVTNLSREEVSDYLGKEIPNWEGLALQPDRIYSLYRPGDELERAASTFRNMPLLSQHIPVSAEDHQPDLVIGAIGTDVEYASPYLRGSLVVWASDSIKDIESGEAKEISCGYRYTPVLEDGVFNGKRFSIRMTDLIANHVALVPQGRATGVVIGDSQPLELDHMSKKAPTRMAVLARGALMAVLTPKLATDSKLDLTPFLSGITAGNWKERKVKIADAIKPKLANDADMADIVKLLDCLDGEGVTEDDDLDPTDAALDEDDEEEKKKKADALAAAEKAKKDGPAAALDEPTATPGTPAAPGKKDDKVDKPAMDAAIAAAKKETLLAVDAAKKETLKLARDIVAAEKDVQPYVGEIVAQDSAEGVYKAALELMKIDVAGVHPSAYRHILQAQPKPGSESTTIAATVAMDAASKKTLFTQFPGLATIKLG